MDCLISSHRCSTVAKLPSPDCDKVTNDPSFHLQTKKSRVPFLNHPAKKEGGVYTSSPRWGVVVPRGGLLNWLIHSQTSSDLLWFSLWVCVENRMWIQSTTEKQGEIKWCALQDLNLQRSLSEVVHYRSSRFIITVLPFIYKAHMRFMLLSIWMN